MYWSPRFCASLSATLSSSTGRARRALAGCAFDLRQAADRLLQALLQRSRITAGLGDQRGGEAVLLREERRKQVLRLDLLMVLPDREALRLGEALPAAWW
jgi:hypothetical protein